MKLSIVIPVYNEDKTVAQVIKQVSDVVMPQITKEIIVVNDASKDKTSEILASLAKKNKRLVVITHDENKGKGRAVRTGFAKATGDYIVVQDADLEYHPVYIKQLMNPILSGTAQVVYGTRLKKMPSLNTLGSLSKSRFILHFFGNRFLSLITSLLYFQWITDMETGYKIFPRAFLKNVALQSEGFSFEPEITAKLIKAGYKIVELPITIKPRGYKEGKKINTWKDGILALYTLVRHRF